MPLFVVTRDHGPAWNASRPMAGQKAWKEHAAFMNALVADGFIILGGPLGGGENVLLIVRAKSVAAIHARLDADPWTPMGLLAVTRIDPWEIKLGDMPTP